MAGNEKEGTGRKIIFFCNFGQAQASPLRLFFCVYKIPGKGKIILCKAGKDR